MESSCFLFFPKILVAVVKVSVGVCRFDSGGAGTTLMMTLTAVFKVVFTSAVPDENNPYARRKRKVTKTRIQQIPKYRRCSVHDKLHLAANFARNSDSGL